MSPNLFFGPVTLARRTTPQLVTRLVLILGLNTPHKPAPLRLLNRTPRTIPGLLSNRWLPEKTRLYSRILLQSHTMVRPGRLRRTLRTKLDRHRNRNNLRHRLHATTTHQRDIGPEQILARSINRTEMARLEEDRRNPKHSITISRLMISRPLTGTSSFIRTRDRSYVNES